MQAPEVRQHIITSSVKITKRWPLLCGAVRFQACNGALNAVGRSYEQPRTDQEQNYEGSAPASSTTGDGRKP